MNTEVITVLFWGLIGCSLVTLGCSNTNVQSFEFNERIGRIEKTGGEASTTSTNINRKRYNIQQKLDFTMTLTTTSLEASSGRLDREHSCERGDTSPHIAWEEIPEGTESLILVMEDPASDVFGWEADVLWTHWVVYSIPPDVTELESGQKAGNLLGNRINQGANDYGRIQYNGPCPIPRLTFPHSIPRSTREAIRSAAEGRQIKPEDRPYYFKLYALNIIVDATPATNRDTLLQTIDGHILAAGELSVNYKSINSRHCYPTIDPEVCLKKVIR